jgi:excisionase family DNA binding protein
MADSSPKPVRPELAVASPSFEQLLDTDEAAALLKIHPKTLQRLARAGEIYAIQVGKLWRFRASELNRWVTARIAS